MTGVRRDEVNERDGMTIHAASPACGGRGAGKRKGAGSRSVSERGGDSSSDIFLVIKNKHLKKKKHFFSSQTLLMILPYKFNIAGTRQKPAQRSRVKFR